VKSKLKWLLNRILIVAMGMGFMLSTTIPAVLIVCISNTDWGYALITGRPPEPLTKSYRFRTLEVDDWGEDVYGPWEHLTINLEDPNVPASEHEHWYWAKTKASHHVRGAKYLGFDDIELWECNPGRVGTKRLVSCED